jgi:protein-S-isoprenylcysteine O-methyltransferase Ste14
MVSILLGVALVLGSVVRFVFPVLFLIAMEVMFVSLEERNLESAFGGRYLRHRKKVKRWI